MNSTEFREFEASQRLFPRWLECVCPDLRRLNSSLLFREIYESAGHAKIYRWKMEIIFWGCFILFALLMFLGMSDPWADWPYSWPHQLALCAGVVLFFPALLSRLSRRANQHLDFFASPDLATVPISGREFVEMRMAIAADNLAGAALMWLIYGAGVPFFLWFQIRQPAAIYGPPHVLSLLEWVVVGLSPLAWLGMGCLVIWTFTLVLLNALRDRCIVRLRNSAPRKWPTFRLICAFIAAVALAIVVVGLLVAAIDWSLSRGARLAANLLSNQGFSMTDLQWVGVIVIEALLIMANKMRAEARRHFHVTVRWMEKALPRVIQISQGDSSTHEEIDALLADFKAIQKEVRLAGQTQKRAAEGHSLMRIFRRSIP